MNKEKEVEQTNKLDQINAGLRKAKRFSRKFFKTVGICLAIAVVVTIFVALSKTLWAFMDAVFGD